MDDLKSFLSLILTPSPTIFLIGTVIVILFPVLLHYLLTRTTPYTSLPTVLLVGPSGAGKTSLMTLLERGPSVPAPAQTHTSQVPSSVELAVSAEDSENSSYRDNLDALGAKAKKFRLLDTPGHGKLRWHALSLLDPDPKPSKTPTSKQLRGIIFLVDSAALSDNDGDSLADAADYLYDVLLALQRRASRGKSSSPPPAVPVLVAANKMDLFTALPATLVRSRLESELGRIRRNRSKGLLEASVGGDDEAAPDGEESWLGEYGSEKFTFGQMREFDIDVDVLPGFVVGGEEAGQKGPAVDKWWAWIGDRL